MRYQHFLLTFLYLGVSAALLSSQDAIAVVNGTTVTAQEQQDLGLVRISNYSNNIGCSGALIANDWAITAGHCLGTSRVQPEKVIFTLKAPNSDPDAISVADAIYFFGGHADEVGPDLALVHLSFPFKVNGSKTGFVNRFWPGDTDSLINPKRKVTVYGEGRYKCNEVVGVGVYRAAELPLNAIDFAVLDERPIDSSLPPSDFTNRSGGNYYELIRNINKQNQVQNISLGDSGGPGFIWQYENGRPRPYIVGVTAGGGCEINRAYQVSIPTVREWIAAVFKTQWNPLATSQTVWVLPAETDGTKWSVQDVNTIGWAQAARAAAAMCYNRGFVGGHFDGHQGILNGNQGFSIQCSSGNALWRDVLAEYIKNGPGSFTDVNTVPWAQANRVADRLCTDPNTGFEKGGVYVGGTSTAI